MPLSSFVASSTTDLGASRTKGSPVKLPPPIPRGSSSTSDATLSPISRAVISTEYASLRYNKHCPSGMYVIPSLDNTFVWDAVLFVHKGVVSIHHSSVRASSDTHVRARILCRIRSEIHDVFSGQLSRQGACNTVSDRHISSTRG